MKRHLIAALMFGLALMTANAASAGPFEDGEAAYYRQDYATALSLLKPLADKGDAAALTQLGLMYKNGYGVAQDYKEAVKLLRLAAPRGALILGQMYFDGTGVLQDYKEAVKWYRLAAAQEIRAAQLYLGNMYSDGQGVARDTVRAHMWYNLSGLPSPNPGVSIAHALGPLQRDNIAKKMTPAQIEKAQDMARKCQASNFQQCD